MSRRRPTAEQQQQQLRADFAAIRDAEAAGERRTFRAKYPGACFVADCRHEFRPPAEVVHRIASGRIACEGCYRAALTPLPSEIA